MKLKKVIWLLCSIFFIALAFSISFLGNNSILQLFIFTGACLTLVLLVVDFRHTFEKQYLPIIIGVVIFILLLIYWYAIHGIKIYSEQTSLVLVFLSFSMLAYRQYRDLNKKE